MDDDALVERLRFLATWNDGEAWKEQSGSGERWEVGQTLNQAAARITAPKEALEDAGATIAAVRATSRTDEWAESSEHFHAVCGRTLRRAARLLTPEADNG